jgi:hypothetical protein
MNKNVANQSRPVLRPPPRPRFGNEHAWWSVLSGRFPKHHRLLGVCAVLALAVWAAPATAAPLPGPQICPSEGTAISGNYRNLTVTGNAYVASGTTLNVRGDLALARGACLDAFTLGTVKVGGNVLVGNNAILALGCAPGVDFEELPCEETTTDDTVGGSLLAYNPYTMYLTADTINGNLVSVGGGPGAVSSPFVNFPIKDMNIQGNALIADWHGGWFGFLRNHVNGSAAVSNIIAADPDSSEVVTNVVHRDLLCYGNSPAVQFGDSGGSSNEVGGFAFGQCGFNVILEDSNYDGGGPQPISVPAP